MNIMQIMTAFKAKDGLTPMFKKAGRQSALFASKFGRSIRSMNAGVNKFMKVGIASFAAVGAAALLVGRQLFNAVDQIATMGDEIAKTSRQLGVGGEALQEWRFAAERQGVSNETLTKSFKLLNRNIGDVRMGQGMLTTTLNRANPALLEQLKNTKDSEEAFELMVKEIGRLDNAQDKAALAQAAFGRSGLDIIKLAEAGAEGLDDLRKKARALGLVMGEKATKEAEKFKDAQTNMNAAFLGLKITLLTGVMPVLGKFMDNMAMLVAINKEDWLKKLNSGLLKLASILKFIWKFRKLFKNIAIGILIFVSAIKIMNFALLAYEVISKSVAIGMKAWTTAQWLLNMAMSANPIGLIVIGVMALIAGFLLLAKRMGGVKEAFRALFSFMKAGLFTIGQLIANYFLLPIQGLLFMLSKIPGVGKKIQGAFEATKSLRESINAGAAAARGEAGQTAGRIIMGTKPEKATIDVSVSAANGTSADVSSKSTGGININNMVLGMTQ